MGCNTSKKSAQPVDEDEQKKGEKGNCVPGKW